MNETSDLEVLLSTFAQKPPLFPGAPWSEEQVAAFEESAGLRLPKDLASLLRAHGEFGIVDFTLDTGVHFEDELRAQLPDGALIIGDNGGGDLYVVDTKNAGGCGAGAVMLVSMGVMDLETSKLVGSSVAATIFRAVRREDLYGASPIVKDARASR